MQSGAEVENILIIIKIEKLTTVTFLMFRRHDGESAERRIFQELNDIETMWLLLYLFEYILSKATTSGNKRKA